jgi:putative ABC transport system ATP-binding protein
MPFIIVKQLTKKYPNSSEETLRSVSFNVAEGEVIALMGPSGCGKSTLLNIIGSLENPTDGEILIAGIPLKDHFPAHLFRASMVGFVFQFHHLVPSMTLSENVETPLIPVGLSKEKRREASRIMLATVGLSHRVNYLPNSVSGGERQRAAIARALINSPRIILADEPTGNLDSGNGKIIMDLMLEQAREKSATVILATHNPELAARADRILQMCDGIINSPHNNSLDTGI